MSTDHPSPATDPAPAPDAVTPTLADTAAPAAPAEASAAPEAPAAQMPAPEAEATAATPPAPAPRMDPAACAAELKARFPALFGGSPKPIKLRIQVDIQARAPGVFPRQALSAFLHRYTTSTNYLIALSQQPQRLDLDGQPAGEVAAEHRDAAAQEVARRRALRKEREAQMQAARRAAQQAEREQAREQVRQQRQAQGATAGAPRPPRPPRPPRHDAARGPQAAPAPGPARAPAPPSPVRNEVDQAARDRARLLRDFDSSPLTKANFCALKGIAPEVLDAQLALARQEAAAWAAAHPRPPRDEQAARPRGDRPRHGRPRSPIAPPSAPKPPKKNPIA